MAVMQTSSTATATEYFESVYQSASGNTALVPWCEGRPCQPLVNWLNAIAPSLIRCGSRVAVVGCGIGDDARELLRRGYEVTAFDVSPTAIRWAKQLDSSRADCYVCADLFKPLPRWRHRFDLVVEVNNLAWLQPESWSDALRSIGDLLTPHGHLLLINPATKERIPLESGPPWAIEEMQLLEAAARAGLTAAAQVSIFADDDDPSQQRMRALFRRA